MPCCGSTNDVDELKNIHEQAMVYAKKKGEIVIVYKLNGFYNYALSLPQGATLIEHVSQWQSTTTP